MAVSVLALFSATAVLTIVWCGCHAHHEVLLHCWLAVHPLAILEPGTSVAELRDRHGADLLSRYPAPSKLIGISDTITSTESALAVVTS
ncbi:hypothetical protein [Saccharothrix longispora]|uniref:hypothetical protein n=1 Tax=Saccharothrix longispora TaxID=33920 RepID=UPI0028FCFC0C|nr:hypothetical protein [Saccharothrix longispora]MDU0289712.1 hypothetical protein [Saccharothrix longispora]